MAASRDDIYRALLRVEVKIDMLTRKLESTTTKEIIMPILDGIKAEVSRNREVDESAKALIVGIKAKLDELASRETVDPADIQALADELGSSTNELADAVVANTPAA